MTDIIIASFLGLSTMFNVYALSMGMFFPSSTTGQLFWLGFAMGMHWKILHILSWVVSIALMMVAHEYHFDWTAFMLGANMFMSALATCHYLIHRKEIESY